MEEEEEEEEEEAKYDPLTRFALMALARKKGLCRGSMDKLYGRGSRAFTLGRRKIR